LEANSFLLSLKKHGLTFLSGVPDSTFKGAYSEIISDPEISYVPAVREDSALGVTSAAYFAGKRGAVIMQNSGLGNVINPLTSFNLMYKVPVLMIIGWRGYQGKDAPEHLIMGRNTPKLLDLLEVPYEILEDDADGPLARLTTIMDTRQVPTALLVREGVIH
jgi:sulfopyruvate decarboxylase subunit alpha